MPQKRCDARPSSAAGDRAARLPMSDSPAPTSMTAPERLRILIVTEDPLYGQGMRLILEGASPYRSFYVQSMRRAQRFCSQGVDECREVVLWILDSFDDDAYAEARSLRQACDATGLCILAHRVELRLVQELLREHAGWFALILRGRRPDVAQVGSTINQVAHGAATVEPRLLERLLASVSEPSPFSNLTAVERRILEMIAFGLRNREIARRIGRSEKAVEKHIGRLFSKLGLESDGDPQIDRRVTAARFFYTGQARPAVGPAPTGGGGDVALLEQPALTHAAAR